MSKNSPVKQAARTTIVGGQPWSASSCDLPPTPVGIEQLLSMAVVDDGILSRMGSRVSGMVGSLDELD